MTEWGMNYFQLPGGSLFHYANFINVNNTPAHDTVTTFVICAHTTMTSTPFDLRAVSQIN